MATFYFIAPKPATIDKVAGIDSTKCEVESLGIYHNLEGYRQIQTKNRSAEKFRDMLHNPSNQYTELTKEQYTAIRKAVEKAYAPFKDI